MHYLKAVARCLLDGVSRAPSHYRDIRRHHSLAQERDAAFRAYRNHPFLGLHIGAEFYVLENWFNTDLEPQKPGIYYIDANQPLPFPSHSFSFVFSEHMIEHISLLAGVRFFAECRRVLKPSGVIRIATPNLRNIVALLSNHDEDSLKYLDWALEFSRLPRDPFPKAPLVVNNFFRSWGHQFIYEPETMKIALQEAGFGEITQMPVGVSRHAPLVGLERHGNTIGDWVNEFETMVFEAVAP